MSNNRILVLGANGLTGRAVVAQLLARGASVRGMASNAASAERVEAAGAAPVVGDIRSTDDLRRAMRGVGRVYHICPPMQLDEAEVGNRSIAAARAEGVRLFVYHSVMIPHTADIAFHYEKMKVQLALLRSSLAYTILQPTNYMQNLAWAWPRVIEAGEFAMPYSAEQGITWVDLADVAEAAACVLTEEGHDFATYELCGTSPITRHEMAALIGQALGRKVAAVRTPPDAHAPRWDRYRPEQVESLRSMFLEYDRHGFRAGNPRILGMLLGRDPADYPSFVRRFVGERAGSAPLATAGVP